MDNKRFTNPNENNIVLYEQIHISKLRYILDHITDYEDVLIPDDPSTKKTIVEVITILRKLVRRCHQGRIKVQYKQNDKQGRYFGEGLQSISRVIRHTISSDYYHDIDISNAHPTFLAHYCHTKGINYTNLQSYITNREEYFQLLQQTNHLSRDEAKQFILAITNGKEILQEDVSNYPTEIIDYYNELFTIRNLVMELEPNLVKLAKKKLKQKNRTEDNLSGSVVNLLMCDRENQVLIEMFNFFTSKHKKVDVLVFDGLMINKENCPESELPQLLRLCEDYIQTTLNITIKLTVKPMDEGLPIPDTEDNSYQSVKTRFEEHNFKCIDKATFYNLEHGMIRPKQKSDMMNAYEHITSINEDGKDECFIRRWFRDPTIRKYEFVKHILPPEKCDENLVYNLWNGFSIEKTTHTNTEGCDILLNHIKLLCNQEEAIYEYVLKWLACLFQKPSTKNNIALCFKSPQGMGKDLFYTMLERMIGDHYCGNTTRIERDIFGDFNKFLENKLLVVMNEMNGKVGYKYSDQLKDLITNIKEPIRKMRTDVSEETKSFAHYVFFTNNDFPIKIETTDRRFVAIDTHQSVPPKSYFDTLVSTINDRTSLRSLYDHLMTIDLSTTDWIRDRPDTEFVQDLKANSQDKELYFLIDRITHLSSVNQSERQFLCKDLLHDFKKECQENGYEYNTTPIKFGIKLKNYHIDGMTKKRTNRGETYIFNIPRCMKWLEDQHHIEPTRPRLMEPSVEV